MYEITENNNYFITRMVRGYREVGSVKARVGESSSY